MQYWRFFRSEARCAKAALRREARLLAKGATLRTLVDEQREGILAPPGTAGVFSTLPIARPPPMSVEELQPYAVTADELEQLRAARAAG